MEVEPSARTLSILPRPDLCDAYALRAAGALNAMDAAKRIFERTPAWVNGLMAVRNLLMKPFGLVTSETQLRQSRERFGMFPVLRREASAVILGLNDKHLDFRIVLEVEPVEEGSSTLVTLGTNVKCHKTLGRAYLTVIKPFHRRIVQAMLRQLAN